ncbi:MAG TPA: endopeptidase La [Spirochaetota bacterium]|nr:endopeptidase La [Spirochaetota bacterium]HSA14227.1 endopeptidase La [Spirochaetota bacterium]
MEIDDIIIDNNDIPIDTDLFERELISIDQVLPETLYIIPIRYRPIFPGIITPLIISQGRFSDVVDRVINESRTIGLVLIKDDDKEEIEFRDLFDFGTAAKILKRINLPDGGVNVLINSVKRFRIRNLISDKRFIVADVDYLDDRVANRNSTEVKALTREVLGQLKMLSDNNPLFTEEMKLTMLNVDEPGKIADFVTSILSLEKNEYQDVLQTLDVKKRLEKVLRLLHKEMEVAVVQKRIQTSINDKIDKQQREFFLREQMKAIKQELGIEEDERSRELKEMKKKVKDLDLSGEVLDKVNDEIEKISLMDSTSSEYTVTRNYLDTVLALPWNTRTEDSIDLDRAEKILNRDHFGLEDVKKRILEFLAVKKLKPDSRGSIICLLGPPGVGKTSLGKSIAASLNRKFFRISLGGMRDEAEIKGHRRTYIGAMPGKIIQGIRICKSRNPVFMLDEIDKMGQSFQGDPASALLEVLDPEQNVDFRDYYLDLPFNLSDVLFITTANALDTIPPVLADRMEIIRLSGYIANEKYEIGRRYLLPKQLRQHGLKKDAVKIDKEGFLYIINGWAREAGVRNLERQIEKICRKTATSVAKRKKIPGGALSLKNILEYLGPVIFTDDELDKTGRPGLVTGLAWTSYGGETLQVESIPVGPRQNGELKLTGQLGDVMIESANIAYSYVQHVLHGNPSAAQVFNGKLVHIHVPAGATPKDGPSAGVTIFSSLYSMATGKIVRPNLAMTGELTLTGRVLPVGGIKEKVIAAKKANIKYIIMPKQNEKDLVDIPDYIKRGLVFHPVSQADEVINFAFPDRRKKTDLKEG